MTLLDKLLALLGLAAFIGFLAIMIGFVPRVDLTIIVIVGIGLAVYDFWLSLRGRHRDDSH